MQTGRSSDNLTSLRFHAKNLARGNSLDVSLESMSPEEIRALLHELQVYQIELKTQNEELRRIHDELEVSKQKYFELYDLAPVGYFSVTKEGLILEVNLTGSNLLQVDRNSLINKSIKRFIIKEDQDIYYKHSKVLFETDFQHVCELRMKHRNGSFFWASLEGNISHEIKGLEPVCRVVISDITQRKRLEQQQLESQQRMLKLQKYESLGLMAGGIVHDFNNILTALIGRIELTLLDKSLNESSKRNLYKALDSSTQAANLTSQILAYSGHGISEMAGVDISNLIEDFEKMLSASISKKIIVSYDLAKGLPAIIADRAQIMQIIMSLVINASEAIGEETGNIRISTGSMKCSQEYLESTWVNQHPAEGQYIYIDVEDTGCGINKENLEKVFDPFFTTKFIGRGLGLAAVMGIVKGHNGTIKIEDNPGKGTRFRVLLPAGDYPARTENKAQVARILRKGKILLVDDEKVVLDVASTMLKHLGHRVVTASNGEEALRVFKENLMSSVGKDEKIDCVILDLSMPRMNGDEALPKLLEINPDIPVIIASGYSENMMKEHFENMGAESFLQKPYQIATLKEKIQKTLSGAKKLISNV